jgi:acetyltransferase-like isoleucine patch superfamily enzyme
MPVGILSYIFDYCFTNYLLPLVAHHVPNKIVPFIHRLRGIKIGRGVFIDKTVILDEAYPQNITIEDDVVISAGAVIMSHMSASHHLKEYYLPERITKVKICKYSLIGINAVILPGVTVGEGAVVVSGSTVLANVPPYTVVSGVPAKKVKTLKRTEANDVPHS